MKKILIAATAGLFIVACNNEKTSDANKTGTDTTKTEMKTETWVPIDSAMMMKAWQENMTMGEPHKMMAKGNGTWDGEVTMWMANGAPPQTSKTTSITESLYGGLYSQSKHIGNMMGSPFEGVSTMGYDNLKKEYFSTWIDNMGSGIMIMTGQWDSTTNKINMTGSTRCMNGQDATMREVFTFVDNDHQTLEMYGPDPATGKEYKNMEIKYTRRK